MTIITPEEHAEKLNAIFGDLYVTTEDDKEWTTLLVQSIQYLDKNALRGMSTTVAWAAELESIERKRR